MASNFLIGLIFAIGASGWIYAKMMKTSGNNATSALIVAGIAGVVILLLMVTILKTFLGGE